MHDSAARTGELSDTEKEKEKEKEDEEQQRQQYNTDSVKKIPSLSEAPSVARMLEGFADQGVPKLRSMSETAAENARISQAVDVNAPIRTGQGDGQN